MEESIFDKMPELEKLLESRPFSALTAEEKEEVLRYMGREEYYACHETILASKARFNRDRQLLSPDPAILRRLLAKMDSRFAPKRGLAAMLGGWFTFRIPVYQPALVIVVLAGLFFFLNVRNHDTVSYLAKTDTVYIEKTVPSVQPQPVVPGKESATAVSGPAIKRERHPDHPASAAARKGTDHPDQYVENAYQKIRFLALLENGHTALDDSSLMKLLVAAN